MVLKGHRKHCGTLKCRGKGLCHYGQYGVGKSLTPIHIRSGAGILSSTFGGCAILEMTSFILSQLYTYHPLIIHKSSISFLAVFKCICAELMTVAEIYKRREILFDRNVIQFHGILCNYEVRCIKPT